MNLRTSVFSPAGRASATVDARIAARLSKLQSKMSSNFSDPLMSWIPVASPHFEEPTHLTSVVDVFEQIKLGKANLRVVIHAPPQMCKTETIMHGLNWLLRSSPNQQHAYATYSWERSSRVSDKCWDIGTRAGFAPKGIKKHWGHSNSKILWTSVGGPLTGEAITESGLLIIDDPNKDRGEAESPTIQAKQRDWLHDVALTRVHPGGSVILNMARWSEQDLAGYAVKELGFTYICLPALDMNDNSLWPSQRPFEFLDEIRQSNEYTWSSLYQGRPRPRGTEVFKSSTTYTALPTKGLRKGYGLDCAYTAKTKSDWSVMLKGVKVGDILFITDMRRKQEAIEDWQKTIAEFTRPGDEILWYVGGQEKTIASLLRPIVPNRHLIVKPATIDKLARALGAAAAWNMGLIQVPEQASWLEDLLSEVQGFTGVNDFHDDIVDALAALWDLLDIPVASYSKDIQSALRRMPKARGF